jgi:hypothetical protein
LERKKKIMKTYHIQVLLLATLLIVTGCATGHKRLEEGLTRLEGQPLSAAVNILDEPQSMVDLETGKVFYWHNQTRQVIMRTTETGEAFLDDAQYNCQIKIITTPQRIITSATHEGNRDACKKWFERFKVQQ